MRVETRAAYQVEPAMQYCPSGIDRKQQYLYFMRHRVRLGDTHIRCSRGSLYWALVYKRPDPDILSGVTWKCSMRSAFCWFAEFCHSQSLSHFAASFIVAWAETSIAKSCKKEIYLYFGWNKGEHGAYLSRVASGCTPLTPEGAAEMWGCKLNISYNWSFRRFTYGNLVTTSPSSKQ